MSFELPKLDYAKSALAPIMSEETLDLHHGKHHQTYITNLNNFIKDTDMSKMTLEEIIINSSKDKSKVGIFNNASQHWNHLLFWKCMKPSGGGAMPTKLKEKIVNDFGSVEEFKKQFIQAGVTQFGSGWSWLLSRRTAAASSALSWHVMPQRDWIQAWRTTKSWPCVFGWLLCG